MNFENSMGYKKIILRLRWLTIIITSYLILFNQGISFPSVFSCLIILFYLFSNIGAYFLPPSYFMKLSFFYIVLVFDTLMVSLGIYLTSQFDTDFYLVYFLIILIASIARSFKLLMINALVICGIYGWFLLAKGWDLKALEEGLLLRIPFIFIINIFYGFLIQAYEERTKRIKMQLQGLEEDIKKYRQIVENAHDAVVILDDERRIWFFNRRFLELTQYAPVELNRAELRKIGDIEEVLDQILNSEEGLQIKEAEVFRKTGEKRKVEVSAAKIFFSSNRPNTIVYLKDITDRKRLEESFFQSEKMRALGEMASGVAHYLNNVLSAILGRAQLLQIAAVKEGRESFPLPLNTLQKELRIIEEAARDGANTIKKIQRFSQPKKNGFRFMPFNVNEFLKETIELVKTKIKDEAEKKGVSIQVQLIEEEDCWVMGDSKEIQEVFLNILFNSIDAMPTGGRIIIKTKRLNGYVSIEVSDTGIGIPNSIRHRIFDPFFTTKGVQRSGLGLSISYGIIRRHHGEIEMESQEGVGTTFIVKLPIAKVVEFYGERGGKEVKEETTNEYSRH